MTSPALISGPVSLNVLQIGDRLFFLFGDQHYSMDQGCEEQLSVECDTFDYGYEQSVVYDSNCWTIGALLDEWFTYNNANGITTDFYLEVPFIKGSKREGTMVSETVDDRRKEEDYRMHLPELITEGNGWLETVAAFFQDCLIEGKSQCEYGPNVKFHYVDIRARNSSGFSDLYFAGYYENMIYDQVHELQRRTVIDSNPALQDLHSLFMLYDVLLDINILLRLCFSFEDIRVILDDIHVPTLTPAINAIFTRIKEGMVQNAVFRNNMLIHRAAAECHRLRMVNPKIANALKDYITYQLINVQKETRDYFKTLYQEFVNINQESNVIESIIELTYLLSSTITVWSPWIMDVYTLARMFLQPSKEVVVFAGHIHTSNQVEFLKFIGGVSLIDHPYTPDNRCIDADLPKILNMSRFRDVYKVLYPNSTL